MNTAFKLTSLLVLFTIVSVQLAAGAQTIQVSPASLARTVAHVQNALSQPIKVWSAGGGAVSYSMTSDVSWLLITPTNGSCSTETNTHLLIYESTNLALGQYSATVAVNGGAAGTQQVSVALTVTDADVTSHLNLNADAEAGVRLANGNSSPYPYRLADGRIRLYYNGSGISSAISTNAGTDFTLEAGTRISSGNDPTVVPTDDNRLRMYFKRSSVNEVGWPIDLVYSAISSNGLDWSDEGLRFTPASGGTYQGTNYTSYASVPEAVVLSNGQVRLFYTSNKSTVVADVSGGGIGSSLSDDGLTFEDEAGARADVIGLVDPALVRLTNGYYWLVVANPYNPQSEKGAVANPLLNGLYSYVSEDGLQFHDRRPIIVAAPGADTTISRATDPGILSLGGDVYRVYYADPYGDQAIRSLIVTVQVVQAQSDTNIMAISADFDGDAKADPAVYGRATGNYYIRLSGSGYAIITTTLATDGDSFPVAADFDGDRLADPSGYESATGKWIIKLSGSGYAAVTTTLATDGDSFPVAADFDGDAKADPAAYNQNTGHYYIQLSASGYDAVTTTLVTDGDSFPVAADFDGDAKADLGVYDKSTPGIWYFRLSGSGYATASLTFSEGDPDRPLAADFDGDAKADPSGYESATGKWIIKLSGSGYAAVTTTLVTDGDSFPVAADFDGDAKADPAVAESSTGDWKIKLSSGNYSLLELNGFLGGE